MNSVSTLNINSVPFVPRSGDISYLTSNTIFSSFGIKNCRHENKRIHTTNTSVPFVINLCIINQIEIFSVITTANTKYTVFTFPILL